MVLPSKNSDMANLLLLHSLCLILQFIWIIMVLVLLSPEVIQRLMLSDMQLLNMVNILLMESVKRHQYVAKKLTDIKFALQEKELKSQTSLNSMKSTQWLMDVAILQRQMHPHSNFSKDG